MENQRTQTERIMVAEEISSLLGGDNLIKVLASYKADTSSKELALEFVNAHCGFIREIVASDIQKKIARSDFEIKDLVSHVNGLMQEKDEYMFSVMVVHSPKHYHLIQKDIMHQMSKE